MNTNYVLAAIGIVVAIIVVAFIFGSNGSPVESIPTGSTTTEDVTQTTPTSTVPNSIDVKIAMIALEDNGASGKKIGCDDSVVMISQEITPYTTGTLRAAFVRLLSLKETSYGGELGLYNSLAQSDLTLDDVSLEDGVATVEISGQPVLSGVCDTPRFVAQLEETALQFDTVSAVEILLNGDPIDEALSQM
jgi:hypothetical protein